MPRRATTIGFLILASSVLRGEAAEKAAFDVASVRVSYVGRGPGVGPFGSIHFSPDTVTIRATSLWLVVRWAYGLGSFQMSGPDWMQSPPYFDIVAKAHGPMSESQLRLMMQALLAERFQMTVHRESKEMSVTALRVAGGGPKFRQSAGKYEPGRGAEAPLQFLGFDDSVHIQRIPDRDGRVRDSFTNIPMTTFAAVLELAASRTPYDKAAVVDETGLRGRFDLTLVLDPHGSGGEGGDAPMQEDPLGAYKRILPGQLGLRLDAGKAPVDVLVIDRASRVPTEN
jgi:uncharacterized protein (TIGR03435 family)